MQLFGGNSGSGNSSEVNGPLRCESGTAFGSAKVRGLARQRVCEHIPGDETDPRMGVLHEVCLFETDGTRQQFALSDTLQTVQVQCVSAQTHAPSPQTMPNNFVLRLLLLIYGLV